MSNRRPVYLIKLDVYWCQKWDEFCRLVSEVGYFLILVSEVEPFLSTDVRGGMSFVDWCQKWH